MRHYSTALQTKWSVRKMAGAVYVYKCGACEATGHFSCHQAAAAAGWTLGQLETKERMMYIVFCPQPACVPKWVREALAKPRGRV